MKAKAAFIVGVGIGYVFGTAAGRQRFERMKAKANEVWHSEPVQSTVEDLQTKASELAKNQGGALVDKVTSTVSEGVRSAFGNEGHDGDDVRPGPATKTGKGGAARPGGTPNLGRTPNPSAGAGGGDLPPDSPYGS